ncbi:putative T6SS immunity periplasmic lipoprotein [Phytobacter sp. V91]|uniref:putative T6SS immunity periplasmic lipoprotein n=1 Tax=Phytobacter sp. V91 TaxID=3369425 RepID=UPI003F60B84D
MRNSELCVFVDKQNLIAKEYIVDLKIWHYASQSFVCEKSYAMRPITLEAGKCIPDVGHFAFVPGQKYSVMINTPLHVYEARFDKPL